MSSAENEPGGPGGGSRRRWVLAVSCVASYLIVSDVAMVNVALPSIAGGVRLTPAEVHWLVTVYALAFSALPLLAGRVADRCGQVRVFVVGLGLFALAASACGLAPDAAVIQGARAVQGVGGAIVSATTLGLITATFTDPAGRRRALAVWSATVSGGAAAGVLLGGVLTAALGWRAVFALDALIGALCLGVTLGLLARRAGRAGRVGAAGVARPLDLPGGLLATAALLLGVAGLSMASTHGWVSVPTLGPLGAAVLVLLVFVGFERRTADPLVPLSLLRSPGRLGAYAVTAVVGAVLYFVYLAVSVYVQRVDASGPLLAGVKSLPAALAVVTGALASTWLARRYGARLQLVTSLVVVAAGFAWLTRITAGAGYWTNLGLPLIVIGLGLGTSFVPATLVATAGVPGHRAGVASGLVTTSRQLGRAVGLAALTGLAVPASRAETPAAIAHGDSVAFGVCAVLALLGVVVAAVAIPRTAPGRRDPAGPAGPAVPAERDPAMT